MTPNALEKHYAPNELAELWHVSGNTIRCWFEGREDVLTWGETHPRGKRRRVSIRIPESVAIKVYSEKRPK